MDHEPVAILGSGGVCLDAARVGAKAAGLDRMMSLGLPVPPAFVLPVGFCATLHARGWSASYREAVVRALADLRRRADTDSTLSRPLAVSVRSGAAKSMPGMLDTVLDLELADERAVLAAVNEVVASWDSDRAKLYRQIRGIQPDYAGAAVVQIMVGNADPAAGGAGVVFSRDPLDGAHRISCSFAFGARGDAVVGGQTTDDDSTRLRIDRPALWAELIDALRMLEVAVGDMVDVEFTVAGVRLWFLQVRAGKRTNLAARRIAHDLTVEGIIDSVTARARAMSAATAEEPAAPTRAVAATILTTGLGAAPGVVRGAVCVDTTRVDELAARYGDVILVRDTTAPDDLPAMLSCAGLLTARGGIVSHAAIVARELGLPTVVGAAAITVDIAGRAFSVEGQRIQEGRHIIIDGASGEVFVPDAIV